MLLRRTPMLITEADSYATEGQHDISRLTPCIVYAKKFECSILVYLAARSVVVRSTLRQR